MNTINRSIIASQVNAAFVLHVGTDRVSDLISRFAENSVPFEYGLFPEQDQRVVASVFYATVSELISLMKYEDKPLQDQPRNGSLEANDTGRGDETGEERWAAICDCLRRLAALERHSKSLSTRARRVREEAGHKTQDGGAIRYNRKDSLWVMPAFNTEEALEDMLARATPNTPWAFKARSALEALYESNYFKQADNGSYYSAMDETEDDGDDLTGAEVIVLELLTEATNVDSCAAKAWDRIGVTMLDLGLEMDRHDKVMAQLNQDLQTVNEAYRNPQERKTKADTVKAEMAAETKEHKAAIRYPLWLLTKQFEPVSLLAHDNTFAKQLVNSPEWRTHEAQETAAKARADAAMAQAQMAEMEANMALMEANMNLMKIRAAMAEQQKAMEKQIKEMAEFMKPAKTKEPKAEKPKAEKAEKKAKAEKPLPKGATILNSRSAFNAPVYRRGM